MPFRRFLLARLSKEAWSLCLPLWRFLLPGFVLLLWMNASFGQWDGGSTFGPRYICSVFPAIGLLVGLCYTGLSPQAARLLEIAVGFSVAFWIAVYSAAVLVPSGESLWGFTFRHLIDDASHASLVRLGVLLAAFELQLITICKRRSRIKP